MRVGYVDIHAKGPSPTSGGLFLLPALSLAARIDCIKKREAVCCGLAGASGMVSRAQWTGWAEPFCKLCWMMLFTF